RRLVFGRGVPAIVEQHAALALEAPRSVGERPAPPQPPRIGGDVQNRGHAKEYGQPMRTSQEQKIRRQTASAWEFRRTAAIQRQAAHSDRTIKGQMDMQLP